MVNGTAPEYLSELLNVYSPSRQLLELLWMPDCFEYKITKKLRLSFIAKPLLSGTRHSVSISAFNFRSGLKVHDLVEQ